MPETDLDLLIDAARAAGEEALRHKRIGYRTWEKADGTGPVTDADLAVDALLRERLIAARPGHGWLSEESEDDAARLTTARQFIVDPIDGTRAFAKGQRDWSHSLAIVERGEVQAAVVFLPERDALYAAALGQGARLNDRPIHTSRTEALEDGRVLAAKQSLRAANWRSQRAPPFETAMRSSIAYRLCLVAEGRFDAMLTLRPAWEWDIAAGALIVAEAGGRSTDRVGERLSLNQAEPRTNGIVAGGALHGAIVAALR